LSIDASLSWSSELDVAGVAGGAMSLDARAAFDEVTSSATSSKSFEQLEKIKETNFETGQYQLYRTVWKTVSFDGVQSTVKTVDYVNGFPIDQPKTLKELRQLARDELDFHYPNPIGKITGSTYRETTCIQKEDWDVKLDGSTKISGAWINSGIPVPATIAYNVRGNVFIIAEGSTENLKMVKIAVTGETTFDWIGAKYHELAATSSCRDQETFSESCFHGTSVSKDKYDVQLVASYDKTPTAVAPTKPKREKSWKCKCISPTGSANGITCAFSADPRPDFTNTADFYCAHWQKCKSWDIVDGASAGAGRYTSYGDKSILESGRYMQRKLRCNDDYCDGHADPPSYSSWCL